MPGKRKMVKAAEKLVSEVKKKNTVTPTVQEASLPSTSSTLSESSLPVSPVTLTSESLAAAALTASFPKKANIAVHGPKYIVGLVDVNSSAHRIYQQWYSLTTKMGMQINLENYLRKQSNFVMGLAMSAIPPALGPEFSGFNHRAIACFDAGCGGRELLMPSYKSQRPRERPAELLQTFEAFRTAISELGDKVLVLPTDKKDTDAEADDMIATAADVCKARGNPCVVISSDRDLLQLVDDGAMCVVYDTLKKTYFDEASAQKRIGVLPRDMLAYKVLAGDTSDNVAGCAAVGATRAAKLVNKYRTLERIIAEGQLDTSFPQKVRDGLRDFTPHVELHKKVMGLQVRDELKGVITEFLEK